VTSSGLVVAGSDTPPVLNAAEVVFEFVAASVEAFGAIGFLGSIAAALFWGLKSRTYNE
jgi:hypothetical protein